MASGLAEPADFDPWSLAEWIEATLVVHELPELSRTALREHFSSGLQPDQAEIDAALAEIRRRRAHAPNCYPFVVENSRVVRRADIDPTVYDFLLLVGLRWAPYRVRRGFEDVNPHFEVIVREALKAHLGVGAQAALMAFPPREDRPTDFAEALRWLAEKMELPLGNLDDVDSADNDGGVDVVCWRPFGDHRTAHLAILVQCSLEVDYDGKADDISPSQWARWIVFGRPPQTALALPFVIPADAKAWERLAGRVDLILDRMRLCELLTPAAVASEKTAMASFVEAERDAILDGPPQGGRPVAAVKRRKPVRKRPA